MYNNLKDLIFKHFKSNDSSLEFEYELSAKKGYWIEKKNNNIKIEFSNKVYLIMALGYIVANLNNRIYTVSQSLKIDKYGIMIDCARNSVPTVGFIKKFILNMTVLGFNYFQLYTEDCMEINNEPYFGYMRGKYTKQEIKELDSFCLILGVELMPCIQTLAHLKNIFRHGAYRSINDIHDILLIEEDRTYELIDNIFHTVNECFTSKNINIGMDEAHMLGLGKYLNKNGYKDKRALLQNHLNHVLAICNKYGYNVSMWSDMFFRVMLDGEYYDNENQVTQMPKNIKNIVPENVTLIYWDYYHTKPSDYEKMIKLHKELTDNISFAGGAWRWVGFTPYNQFTVDSFSPAIKACNENGIQNIMLTAWGDDGGECSLNSLMGAYILSSFELYSEKNNLGNYASKLALLISGYTIEELFCMDLPNNISPEYKTKRPDPCKYLFYDDLLIGMLIDKSKEETTAKYSEYAIILKKLSAKKAEFSYLFKTLYKLCDVLKVKADLGKRIREAYINKNMPELKNIVSIIIPDLIKKIKSFYLMLRNQWESENKTFGFEIQDIRIGGLLQRLKNIKYRLEKYINKNIAIAELEEKFLTIDENFSLVLNNYKELISFSLL